MALTDEDLLINPGLMLNLLKTLVMFYRDEQPHDERTEIFLPIRPRRWPKLSVRYVDCVGSDEADLFAIDLVECDETQPSSHGDLIECDKVSSDDELQKRRMDADRLQRAISTVKLRLIKDAGQLQLLRDAEASIVEKVRQDIYGAEESA